MDPHACLRRGAPAGAGIRTEGRALARDSRPLSPMRVQPRPPPTWATAPGVSRAPSLQDAIPHRAASATRANRAQVPPTLGSQLFSWYRQGMSWKAQVTWHTARGLSPSLSLCLSVRLCLSPSSAFG